MPLLNKMLFASDHVGLQAIQYFRQSWILFFLVPPMGEGIARVPDVSLLGFDVDARVFAGFLIFAGRFIDAFTDPLIGWWSDRTRSRWGRRIPFILFSTPFYALFAAMVWFLPTEDASLWNAIYFVIVLELFFTAATMSSGALEALVPEVAREASDRMNLVGLIFLFAIFGAVLGLAISGPLVDALGFQGVGVILAAMGIGFRYVSLAAVWKHAPRDTTPAMVSFWRSMRETIRNPQFVYFLPTFVMFTTGVGVMMGWIPFFASQVLLAEEEGTVTGLIFALAILGAVVSGLVFWRLISRVKMSKRRVYGSCLVASGVGLQFGGVVGRLWGSGPRVPSGAM
ncbi:MAG: MFS transporter, partial [Chloroflexi bacterium]|nr:MFS transporter [Chloroflexota bacterium]